MTTIALYLHIPKAGGTALNDWFYRMFRTDEPGLNSRFFHDGVFYYPFGFVRYVDAEHCSEINEVLHNPRLRAVVGHFQFGIHERIPRSTRYITVLRHPVERIISLYYFQRLVQGKYGDLDGYIMPDDMSLADFAQNPPYKEIDNGQTRRLSGMDPDLGRCGREALAVAKNNVKEHFAVVGTARRTRDFIAKVKDVFGLSRWQQLHDHNVNPLRPGATEISQESVSAIRNSNGPDIELYEFVSKMCNE